MFKHKKVLKILLILAICPIALPILVFVVEHKKFWTYFLLASLLSCLFVPLLLLQNCIFGEGLRLFYTYNKDQVRVIEDSNFVFYKGDYTASYNLKSKYYVSHRILLIPESKTVPVTYKFDGEMLVEIYDKNHELLHSFKANSPVNLLREGNEDCFEDYLVYIGKNTSRATSVFAFELGKIPFELVRLKWSRLKNIEVKVTVIKPETGLLKYCNTATLVIIPDLRL